MSEPTKDETNGFQLREIAGQIRRWLKWHRQVRDCESLATSSDTAIMALPVPTWPTHGQLEAWIAAMERAADKLDPNRAYEIRP
jgi:hypothetical protein